MTPKIRAKIIDEEPEGKKRCAFCRQKDWRLHVHHINEDRTNNNADNLIPLCQKHHTLVHSRINEVIKKYGMSGKVRKVQTGYEYSGSKGRLIFTTPKEILKTYKITEAQDTKVKQMAKKAKLPEATIIRNLIDSAIIYGHI